MLVYRSSIGTAAALLLYLCPVFLHFKIADGSPVAPGPLQPQLRGASRATNNIHQLVNGNAPYTDPNAKDAAVTLTPEAEADPDDVLDGSYVDDGFEYDFAITDDLEGAINDFDPDVESDPASSVTTTFASEFDNSLTKRRAGNLILAPAFAECLSPRLGAALFRYEDDTDGSVGPTYYVRSPSHFDGCYHNITLTPADHLVVSFWSRYPGGCLFVCPANDDPHPFPDPEPGRNRTIRTTTLEMHYDGDGPGELGTNEWWWVCKCYDTDPKGFRREKCGIESVFRYVRNGLTT
ncbi:hypothetical protein I317_00892 [Kwoniella heveanensis CBS 569]|uniref:Uncharacterized protein n=1 Tax=Kwoniella heveanensis BCC8398 TaxID=1296120 RepID=A0A1B9GP49_9TREE|nr:hypothetical protein I316_05418 [Kwoniella heveanensis BCC8398]OCF45368.1 hypothetical protein I317_00892 [Kwoniella heveanensis CBS 569]